MPGCSRDHGATATMIKQDQHWVSRAEDCFANAKPAHFTDFRHCCECAEHDETLRTNDRETIGLAELGNPGWDPLCFCTGDGLLYYVPAMIRLSLQTLDEEFYFSQLLFHLEYDGEKNRLLTACTAGQRSFVEDFLYFMIDCHADRLEKFAELDNTLRVAELWSGD